MCASHTSPVDPEKLMAPTEKDLVSGARENYSDMAEKPELARVEPRPERARALGAPTTDARTAYEDEEASGVRASRRQWTRGREALGGEAAREEAPGCPVATGPRQRRRIICECPAGCQRQVEDRMLHSWLCLSCSGAMKDLPEDPCRCGDLGATCCKELWVRGEVEQKSATWAGRTPAPSGPCTGRASWWAGTTCTPCSPPKDQAGRRDHQR